MRESSKLKLTENLKELVEFYGKNKKMITEKIKK
jgi:hypothetical protein